MLGDSTVRLLSLCAGTPRQSAAHRETKALSQVAARDAPLQPLDKLSIGRAPRDAKQLAAGAGYTHPSGGVVVWIFEPPGEYFDFLRSSEPVCDIPEAFLFLRDPGGALRWGLPCALDIDLPSPQCVYQALISVTLVTHVAPSTHAQGADHAHAAN